jgi:hypothetical protein
MKTLSVKVALTVSLGALMGGCGLLWDGHQNVVLIGRPQEALVCLVPDNLNTQDLVRREEARVRRLPSGRPSNPSEVEARRIFIDNLRALGLLSVPLRTHARLIDRTNCRCEIDARVTARVIKVQISEGNSKGFIGWVCESSVSYSPPVL